MTAKPLRPAVPKNLLSYLNSFENDRNHYIPDPTDERRIAVANQKIFNASGSSLLKDPIKIGDKIKVIPVDPNRKRGQEIAEDLIREVLVIGKSFWNPDLLLLEGDDLLEKGNVSKDWQSPDRDLILSTIATNCVTMTSPDVTQDHDPTRTSDGSSRKTPAISGDEDKNSHPAFAPLTEYWLGKAFHHNQTYPDAPVVAILDTGIDFQFDWTMRTLPDASCPLWFNEGKATENKDNEAPFQKDLIGWNFVGSGDLLGLTQHQNPFDDDRHHKHGTRIAAIVAHQCRQNKKQCAEHVKDPNVRMMILKTHDYRGVGLLFDIFCAFDYILAQKKVNIINASWGFYGSEIPAFKAYLDKFEEAGIWFVTAAGNSNDFEDEFRIHQLRKNSPTGRYPACYSTPGNKVLTVTTATHTRSFDSCHEISQLEIECSENYSNEFVDIAVAAGRDGCFPEPLCRTNDTVRGTSYSTAYVIGKLVRSGKMAGKADFLDDNNKFIHYDSSLRDYVRDGHYIFSDIDEKTEHF